MINFINKKVFDFMPQRHCYKGKKKGNYQTESKNNSQCKPLFEYFQPKLKYAKFEPKNTSVSEGKENEQSTNSIVRNQKNSSK